MRVSRSLESVNIIMCHLVGFKKQKKWFSQAKPTSHTECPRTHKVWGDLFWKETHIPFGGDNASVYLGFS